jgi:hypothetical protein
MAMCSFVHPFREAKFCGVPSCVFDKLGCAAGEEKLLNTGLAAWSAGVLVSCLTDHFKADVTVLVIRTDNTLNKSELKTL